MNVRKPEAKEARENASKSEPATDPNADQDNKVPAGAENFEHTLRRLYIRKEALRR